MNSIRCFITIASQYGENPEIRYIGKSPDGLQMYSLDSQDGTIVVSCQPGHKLAIIPDEYLPTKEITHASP